MWFNKEGRKRLEVALLLALASFTLGGLWSRFRQGNIYDELTKQPPVDFVNGAKPNVDYFKNPDPRYLYLDLMKLSLTDLLYEDQPELREGMIDGTVRPRRACTLIGLQRLDNIQQAVTAVLAEGVPGDLIEAGAWKGGATIFMRAVLKAYGVMDRTVWVADSFEGLPVPNPAVYPADAEYDFFRNPQLKVAAPYVVLNFQRFGLYDGQVRFLKGWFKDTLPAAPIEKLAVLRVDGDLYQSTMEALNALYDRVSPRGWVIIDDYSDVPPCRKATDEFRRARGITDPIQKIDSAGVYWVKSK